MRKERITYIYQEDLNGLEQDENGNYVVPEGFEIYRVIDTRQEEIEQLEQQISKMTIPTNEELIEEGKLTNDYYYKLRLLDELRNL